ncbi:MAG: sensor histidine kinase [Crocinitomicaceae bacterium]
MLKNVHKKWKWLAAAILTFFVFGYVLRSEQARGHSAEVKVFQERFLELERELDRRLDENFKSFRDKGIEERWINGAQSENVNIHVYRRDSLKYWSTNELPILRFAEIHFPAQGLVHLQNGWYYAKMKSADHLTVCASFLIKQDYSYQNDDLENDFADHLKLDFSADISLDRDNEENYSIKDSKGDYVLSIQPQHANQYSETKAVVLLLLLVAGIIFLVIAFLQLIPKGKPWNIVAPIFLLFVRYLALKLEWFGFMEDVQGFDPTLYASSGWFPTFFDFLLNVALISYLLFHIGRLLEGQMTKSLKTILGVVSMVIGVLVWWLITWLIKGSVDNSTIPLVFQELFTLNAYSIITVAAIGVLFYSFLQFLKSVFQELGKTNLSPSVVVLMLFFVGCGYFAYDLLFGTKLIYAAAFPLLVMGLLFYVVLLRGSEINLNSGMVILFLFSMVVALHYDQVNRKKEEQERKLYANQFATERSVAAEAEYMNTLEKLKEDNFLSRYISSPASLSISDFQDGLERRVFNGFWERYELSFAMFAMNNDPLIKDVGVSKQELDEIIESSGEVSQISPSMYFIDDYKGQYTYIIHEILEGRDSTQAHFYCTLKSKKIPEEIGFPRLLISTDANVSEPLENYSIAKYHNNQLVTKYGEFDYPTHLAILDVRSQQQDGFLRFDGFDHYFLRRGQKDYLILSKEEGKFSDLFTSFSYLFSFFGILLIPVLFRRRGSTSSGKVISLALKIQIALVSIVFLSLFAFGWGTGSFVSTQYNEFTNDVITEKLNSVETEVKSKLGSFEQLTLEENGNYMQYILQKFSRVFFTDINLYNTDGYLLATSRPKVFNKGLISEQMNPRAYRNLNYGKKSEYVHREKIGKLSYSSAYQPFYNKKGAMLGYINLQHFGQQQEFESQIEQFLVAIINVFILLLAVSTVLAIFISNWLTEPLRILQESFAAVKFGEHNQSISYDKEDEIGALVKEYNQKLAELELTAQQLARSERESAWREMAKQVAHEIKNPLTPMKLSVQQLLRSYDPSDPESEERLKRVANSMIEQIDALTKIANEFSNFAKMPQLMNERMNIVPVIEGVCQLFSDSGVQLNFETFTDTIYGDIDKDQFVRVFNNLIQNAVQSIAPDTEGQIAVRIMDHANQVKIEIEDNGQGIEEEMRSKIFVPYFTTKGTGTGLGLAMVKQIIENHGGSIYFDSEIGKGTCFTIMLPKSKK